MPAVLHNTLVDGEMVCDNIGTPEAPQHRWNFLIFDVIMYEGKVCAVVIPTVAALHLSQSLVERTYEKRLEYVRHVVGPRETFRQFRKAEPFGIRIKQFFPLEKLDDLLHLIPKITHEQDGFILAADDERYKGIGDSLRSVNRNECDSWPVCDAAQVEGAIAQFGRLSP